MPKRKVIITSKDRDIRLNLDTLEEIPVIIADSVSIYHELIGFVVKSGQTEGKVDNTVYPPEMKYLCPRCTNVAYICEGILERHPVDICEGCGLPLPEMDKTRFIPL